jgi:PAS domain-containing protein
MSHQIDVEKILIQKLMDDSPDYIFIKDRQSHFVITNQAHAHLLLGLENPDDAVGKTDFVLFPDKPDDVKRFYAEEQAIMETGQPVIRREWTVPSTTTGEIVWLSESKNKQFALPEIRAEMVLPLVSRQEIIGALNIHSTAETTFTE